MYALNIDTDSRILSATFDRYAPAQWPRVDTLPQGDITDYLFNGDTGSFERNALPRPKPPQPPESNDTAAEIARLKERINKLEQNAAPAEKTPNGYLCI